MKPSNVKYIILVLLAKSPAPQKLANHVSFFFPSLCLCTIQNVFLSFRSSQPEVWTNMRVLGTVKLLVRCVKCGTSVVSSSKHTHGFQQAPKGVLIQKTWLENHWSVSVFYGLVPASRCTCIANHCPRSSYPSCSDPLSAPQSSRLILPQSLLLVVDSVPPGLHRAHSAQMPLLEMVLPWSPNLKGLPSHFYLMCN